MGPEFLRDPGAAGALTLMDRPTVEALNRLNREFYDRFADEFGTTRERPWPGWERVLETWLVGPPPPHPRILDAGCGNGRFGRYLEERLEGPFDYLGVDSSPRLLEAAARRLPAGDRGSRELLRLDLVTGRPGAGLPDRRFDLVAAFGLLHHVPSTARRRLLLAGLADLVLPGGLLAVAFWQFAAEERFRRRAVPWQDHNRRAREPIDLGQLEPGDYLLPWGDVGAHHPDDAAAPVRYCHFTEPREAERLVADLPLSALDSFRADGARGEQNLYFVLIREKRRSRA